MSQSTREAERGKKRACRAACYCIVNTSSLEAFSQQREETIACIYIIFLHFLDLQRALYSASGESYALIFNILHFAPPCHLPTRWGSEKDAEEAKKVLEDRNFTVHSFPDCTADEIRKRLKVIGDDQRNFKRLVYVMTFVMTVNDLL